MEDDGTIQIQEDGAINSPAESVVSSWILENEKVLEYILHIHTKHNFEGPNCGFVQQSINYLILTKFQHGSRVILVDVVG